MIISRSILLRNRRVSDESLGEYQTHILYAETVFENHAVFEIMSKNIESERPQMTIWRMRFACWIPKVTNIHSEYVMLTAFPWQQWLRESASMLSHPYTGCCANCNFRKII
jgi:hypothetical protein